MREAAHSGGNATDGVAAVVAGSSTDRGGRWLMVAVSAHVLGTLLTVFVEARAIRLDAASRTWS